MYSDCPRAKKKPGKLGVKSFLIGNILGLFENYYRFIKYIVRFELLHFIDLCNSEELSVQISRKE